MDHAMEPRPCVIRPEKSTECRSGLSGVSCSVVVDRSSQGCRNLVQRIIELAPGAELVSKNEASEEVFFVVSGKGAIRLGTVSYGLEPEMGVLASEDTAYSIQSTGPEALKLISVLSPQPGRAASLPPSKKTRPGANPTVRASRQKVTSAGGERRFKLMIDPRHGARYVTQFIGYIAQSKAPFHKHEYEEVITILDGQGVLHLASGSFPVDPGSCIYLPAGAEHCLENPHPEPLRIVGVFSPSGSPAARY